MIKRNRFSRRVFLGGGGALVALPFLESLVPKGARAATGTTPKRLLFYYVPNGIVMSKWIPSGEGAGFALPPILKGLEAVRGDVSVLTNLENYNARPDGPGDHASGTGAFLTCAKLRKTEGTDIQNGISVDQVAANAIGHMTRFPSLQLGIDGGSSAGNCDSGYSCAYARNISWAGVSTPLPKVTNPQTAFDRLFEGFDPGLSRQEQQKRRHYKASVLDGAVQDAERLNPKLGRTDRQKLDEFMTGVRELERRIQDTPLENTCDPGSRPGTGLSFQDHLKVMADIMVLAFQCDMTRIATFMLGNAASGRNYSFLGVSGAHHELSHHQSNANNLRSLETINTWEIEQFGYLLRRMKEVDDGNGSLLDNSAVFFSSEISDGDRHNHNDLPVLLAGKGGGAFRPGRHVVYPKWTKISHLFIAMLASVGVNVASFGDGNQPLGNL